MRLPNDATVILDVGHGNCSIIRSGNQIVVADAGPGESLLEFLSDEGIKKIDNMLISHADRDHIAGLIALLSSGIVRIRKVLLNSDAEKGTDLWDDLLWELELARREKKLEFEVGLTSAKDPIRCGDVFVHVVGPSPYLAARGVGNVNRYGERISSNTISAVLKVVTRGRSRVLLTGDLDRVGLEELEREGVDLAADVLVFPHHGGHSGSASDSEKFSRALVAQVRPNTVIFSIGRASGKAMNPLPDVVRGVRDASPQARISCTQLSRRCTEKEPAEQPRHLLTIFAQGRAQRRCCAGTLVILHTESEVLPQRDEHLEFIAKTAPNALCRSSPR